MTVEITKRQDPGCEDYGHRRVQSTGQPERGGFVLVFDEERFERHTTPESAAEALANGTCAWPSAGDPSEMGIPEDISEWQRVP